MPKGFGKALQEALDGKEQPQPTAPAPSPLLNERRRQLLGYLCLRPFSTGGRIASDLKMSPSSVVWHVRSLLDAGYVAFLGEGGLYYPKNFVDIGDVDMFVVLNSPGGREALRESVESPGISQTEMSDALAVSRQVASRILSQLTRLGLLIRVQDGRFARWYPTDLLMRKRESHLARSRAFVEMCLRRLEDEGQSPQVLRHTENELQVRLGKGRNRGVLSLPLDPYGAVLC